MHYKTLRGQRPWLSRAAGLGVLLVGVGLLLLGAFAVAFVIAAGTLMALLAIGLSALTGRPVLRWRYRVPRTDTSTGQVIEGEYHVIEPPRGRSPKQGSPFD